MTIEITIAHDALATRADEVWLWETSSEAEEFARDFAGSVVAD